MASAPKYRGLTEGTITGGSILATVALLVIFACLSTVAIWRTSADRDEHIALESKSNTVAALQEARAQFYLSATLLSVAASSETSAALPMVDAYNNATEQGEASLREAERAFEAEDNIEALTSLQSLDQQLLDLRPTLDALINVGLSGGDDFAPRLSTEYLPQVWPSANRILVEIGDLAELEQAQLTEATAEANNDADSTLWMMILFGIAGFLLVLALPTNLIRSMVRPLASLQESVRAVASGDMETRAEVSGPREVASLAADFNTMITRLQTATEEMQHRLEVESAVARTSALLDKADDVDSGLKGALRLLAEAVAAEHSYIFTFDNDHKKMRITHEWNAPGKTPPPKRFADVDCAAFAWWVGQLMRDEEVVVEDVSHLPAEATAERAILTKMNVKCALAVPFGPNGKPVGFVGFGDTRIRRVWREEDIRMLRLASENILTFINRRRAEDALRESEERFRSLSSAAPIGIFLTDKTGGSVYVNEHLLSISGLTLDAALGLGWASSIHPDDREDVLREKERANRDNDEFAKDFRITTPQGGLRCVSVRSRPAGDDGARVGTLEDITARKQAEDALRQSETRFRTLGASAPIGIFETDLAGNTVFQNDRLTEMVEQSFGSEHTWQQAIHPEDRDEVIAEVVDSLRRGEEFAKEFRVLTPKGKVGWIRVHARGLRAEDGSLTGVVGTIEDITNRKQAEADLRRSEERFRTLGASAPVGIFHSDAKGKVIFVNDRFAEITGGSFQDSTRNWFQVVHPEDRDAVFQGVVAAIKAGGEFAREFRLLTREGVTRWVSARAKDLRADDGRFIGLMGTIEDVTARREWEQTLLQSEERFRSLSTSAPVGILLISEANAVTYTNERLRAIVGLDTNETVENVSSKCVLDRFVHPEDRRGIAEAHAEALARPQYEFRHEFRIITVCGETRWLRAHVIPISSDGGRAGRVGTVEDITERRMLEEERQSAFEGTTLLLAMAAEARDPYTEHHLFRIRGYVEAIALRMGLTPEKAKAIGLASLLHDIGKTRVPDAILTKPGPLNEEEWQIMRRHTVWGEELLPTGPLFVAARQIARHHHENWDGTGYPDQLRGDDIPLAAMIVAVADGFDAMTSKRPYKGAWPPARAMHELRSDNGHQYSPVVVAAFERAVEDGTIARIASVRRTRLSDLTKAA